MPHPNEKYIKALLHNDTVLLEEIYQRFSGKIKSWIRHNGGTEADAGDVFQEALLAIYRRAAGGDFTLTCPFDAFLFLVCRNKWLSEIKVRKRTLVTNLDVDGYKDSNGAEVLAEEVSRHEDRTRLLHQKLGQMGEGCRRLLSLCWQHSDMQQVAELLQVSYGYARKKKSECMEKLIKLVQADPDFENLKW